MRALERSGRLPRAVEALPDDRQLGERRRDGQGADRSGARRCCWPTPSSTPTPPCWAPRCPTTRRWTGCSSTTSRGALRERFPEAVAAHPLRREIVATALTNRAVNVAGVTGLFRLSEETGVPLATVVRAHAVARAVFDVDRMWDAVRPLDNQVPAAVQVELRGEATRLAERGTPLAAAAART